MAHVFFHAVSKPCNPCLFGLHSFHKVFVVKARGSGSRSDYLSACVNASFGCQCTTEEPIDLTLKPLGVLSSNSNSNSNSNSKRRELIGHGGKLVWSWQLMSGFQNGTRAMPINCQCFHHDFALMQHLSVSKIGQLGAVLYLQMASAHEANGIVTYHSLCSLEAHRFQKSHVAVSRPLCK